MTLYSTLLTLHITAGFTALVSGGWAIGARKGQRTHRLMGKLYFWAMALVAVSAVLMTFLKPNPFLMLIAVLSFYSSSMGYRILGYKKLHEAQRFGRLEWAMAVLLLLAGLGLFGVGGTLLFRTQFAHNFGWLSLFFGGISVALAVRDLRLFRQEGLPRYFWLFYHIQQMMAAYIATVTAFSSVNLTFMPTLLRWTWPTLVGTLLATWFRRRYEAKLRTESLV